MNYGQEQAAVNYSGKIEGDPELIAVNSRLAKSNSEYINILSEVEDKLHNILNLRNTSDSGVKPNEEKSINDFISSIHKELNVYNAYNNRLQKVLEHIKKIIG